MKKELYIHLGAHKTGTTSLQIFCDKYRKQLSSRLKLYYPCSPAHPFYRHKGLFPVTNAMWEKIYSEARRAGCEKILISNESLFFKGVSDDDLQRIKSIFHDFVISYVLYLPRIDKLCKSMYAQSRKTGHLPYDLTFADYLAKSRKRCWGHLNPTHFLERCRAQVGKEHIIVRPYDRTLLKNGSTIDDMLEVMGLEAPAELARGKDRNISIPTAALPYMTPGICVDLADDYSVAVFHKKLAAAFNYSASTSVPPSLTAHAQSEIDKVDAKYLAGYKKQFEKNPLQLEMPELKADPYHIYVADLLQTIHQRQMWPERLCCWIGGRIYKVFKKISLLF